MKFRIWIFAISAFSCGGLTACATVSSVSDETTDESVSFSVPHECQSVRQALDLALDELKFKIESVDDSGACSRKIVAKKSMSAFSWGELVRVDLREGDSDNTILEVVTKRRVAVNITAKGDWSEEIHDAVIRNLD